MNITKTNNHMHDCYGWSGCYGWYSMNAYLNGEKETIYSNYDGQETHCTIISDLELCPYPKDSLYYKDVVFMGKIII